MEKNNNAITVGKATENLLQAYRALQRCRSYYNAAFDKFAEDATEHTAAAGEHFRQLDAIILQDIQGAVTEWAFKDGTGEAL